MSPRIGLVGAAGETGSSILNALLSEEPKIDVVALSRPSSLNKPANLALKERGVELRTLDLTDEERAASSLRDIDVLISAMGGADQLAQIPLVTAAKAAGVKRFIPCAFLPVIPSGGLHILRDTKQEVYNKIFQLRLPYTIVDVGWWSQLSIPRVPSGKLDAYAFAAVEQDEIPGKGTVLSALTDLRDIGRYVAKIALDDRTINKWVFVYNELWSQNAIYDLVEKKTGEKIERNYISEAEYLARIAESGDKTDLKSLMIKVPAQYLLSWGIRGDNTPENAKYLGYLTSKELYPDMQFHTFDSLIDESIAGTLKTVHDDHKAGAPPAAA